MTIGSMSQGLIPIEGFTFGCDPELFVMNGKGEFVTAEGLIPGTKAEPFAVEGGAVQVDGMAAEFNIDPVSTFEDFDQNITKVMASLKKMLPAGHRLVPVPAVVFSEEEWKKAPDCAKELGCSPDYNAWKGSVNPPPSAPGNPRLRTGSGHLHIGWTEDQSTANLEHLKHCTDLVKQLDWYLGAWATAYDNDNTRRQLYGQAGACRIKEYGVEYRVLSNFWLTEKRNRLLVWNRMQMAIHDMRDSFFPEKAAYSMTKTGYDFNDAVIRTINTGQFDDTLINNYRYPIRSL